MNDEEKKERNVLRDQYDTLTGKNHFPGWSSEQLKDKIEKYAPEQAKELEKNRDKPNYHKYRELPPPIKDHLEKTFGAWLDHIEVGQEWKKDFGGYAMYIKVPEQFSTEWKTHKVRTYDNRTRTTAKDKQGNPIMNEFTEPDVRWKSLADLSSAVAWLNMVKDNIINTAYRSGLQLPNTATTLEETKQTVEAYKASIHK